MTSVLHPALRTDEIIRLVITLLNRKSSSLDNGHFVVLTITLGPTLALMRVLDRVDFWEWRGGAYEETWLHKPESSPMNRKKKHAMYSVV